MTRLDLVAGLWLIIAVAGVDSAAGPMIPPFTVTPDEVEWVASDVVSGAQEARLGPTGQRLHRWPVGAGTAWQRRGTSWDAVLISGRLTLSLEGRRPKTLGSLSYIKIREWVGHKFRCEGPGSCLLLGFSGQQALPEPYWTEDSVAQAAHAPSAGVLVVNLAAADWSPDPPPDGVEIGSVRGEGLRAPALPLIGPSTYFIYRLALGTRLPLNHSWAESRGFTLQGTALIDFGEGVRELLPASMYGLEGRMGFLECKVAPCIVLATSKPPSWRR